MSGPGQEMVEVQRPNITGSDPQPEDAAKAILAAFDKYEVVGMGAAHGNKDLDDFILRLIRDPGLPGRINDIAVECGNSLYQPILDRYIAGDDVGLEDVRPVWRNTTQPMCSVSAFYEELFPLVRRINQKLPPTKKFRVLAGDPPIDWSKVKTRDDATRDPAEPATLWRFMMRDPAIASVMEKEVLSKHRKALMLFGTGHLYHNHGGPMLMASAVEMYEKNYPGVTLVIADHTGFGSYSPVEKYNDEFESRMAGWPIPSLVEDMAGTWLADLLDKTHTFGGAVLFRVGKDGKRTESPGDSGGVPLSKMVGCLSLSWSEGFDAEGTAAGRDLPRQGLHGRTEKESGHHGTWTGDRSGRSGKSLGPRLQPVFLRSERNAEDDGIPKDEVRSSAA